MINQISTGLNTNVYSPVQSSNGGPYYVTKSLVSDTQKQEEQEKLKSKNAAWYTVAITAMGVGLGVLFLSKGLSKNAKLKLNKFYKKALDSVKTLGAKDNLSFSEKLKHRFSKFVSTSMVRSKILFNGAPIKDAFVMNWINKYPKLRKISDKVTNIFEKISVKTSKRQYKKTSKHFDAMFTSFNAHLEKLPESDKLIVQNRINNMKRLYIDGFSDVAQNQRLTNSKKSMAGLDKEVYQKIFGDVKGFWNSQKSNNPFISEAVASKFKSQNFNIIEGYRSSISNSVKDNYRVTKKMLKNIELTLDLTDETSNTLIKNINSTLDKYKLQVDSGSDAKRVLLDGHLSDNLGALSEHITKSGKYDPESVKKMSENISNLRKVLDKNKMGELQEIMSIFKNNLPDAEYQVVKKSAYKAANSLNKSADMEADKLFDKIRDLVIGSAPMDVLGLFSSLGVVGWGLLKADNNDERISATLKYGIPAVGGVATTLYCTLGLVSAGPALIIGAVSGALINQLGMSIDKARKKRQGKTVLENEASMAQMSAEKIKHMTKGLEQKIVLKQG